MTTSAPTHFTSWHPLRFVLIVVLLILVSGPARRAQTGAIRGFPSDAVAAERQREEQFSKDPGQRALKEYMAAMAGEPHVAGRPGSRRVAEYALQQFKSWGLDARIESFEALMPWPTERVVEMVAPTRAVDGHQRAGVPEDPDTAELIRRRSSTRIRPTATQRAKSSTSTTACRPTTSG